MLMKAILRSRLTVDVNDPGFEHLTDEQTVDGALYMFLEDSEEEEQAYKTQNPMVHDVALTQIDGLIQYLEQ